MRLGVLSFCAVNAVPSPTVYFISQHRTLPAGPRLEGLRGDAQASIARVFQSKNARHAQGHRPNTLRPCQADPGTLNFDK